MHFLKDVSVILTADTIYLQLKDCISLNLMAVPPAPPIKGGGQIHKGGELG